MSRLVNRFPKLDVAGSNPVARSRQKSLAERVLGVPSGGRKCGLEVLVRW
jgi:hypothetical protein